jgi:2-polyprenyl-3-methyl-5-hydroxy-6-metoxy-1,4-benzoquinol methylase
MREPISVGPELGVPETPDVVIGNHHHKYSSTNPVIRRLTEHWLSRLDELARRIAQEDPAARVLEVGCGEGEIARRLHKRWGDVTALDLPDAGLRADWMEVPGPRFRHADAERLPFADDAFDVLVSVEVLEHLRDPDRALREYARVARRHLLLSVPREPIFRAGNLLAGRYVRHLGNTPGHLNHWTTPGFIRFCSQVGSIRATALPLPWTVLWVRLG